MGKYAGYYLPSPASVDFVVAGESDWYAWYADRTVTYTLTPLTGDVDLFVYDNECNLICASLAPSMTIDSCVVHAGFHRIEVRYFSNPINYLECYALTVTQVGGNAVIRILP